MPSYLYLPLTDRGLTSRPRVTEKGTRPERVGAAQDSWGARSRGAAGNVTSANGRRSGPLVPRAAGLRARRGPAADYVRFGPSFGRAQPAGPARVEHPQGMSTERVNSHNRPNGTGPDGLSIQEAAERVGVAASTLRRWARQGLLPRYDGQLVAAPWSATPGSWPGSATAGIRSRRSGRRATRAGSRTATSRSCSPPAMTLHARRGIARDGARSGADRPGAERARHGTGPGRAAVRGRHRAAPVRRRRARRGPAAGGAASTRACIWAGDGASRGRRGAGCSTCTCTSR